MTCNNPGLPESCGLLQLKSSKAQIRYLRCGLFVWNFFNRTFTICLATWNASWRRVIYQSIRDVEGNTEVRKWRIVCMLIIQKKEVDNTDNNSNPGGKAKTVTVFWIFLTEKNVSKRKKILLKGLITHIWGFFSMVKA